MKIDFPFNNTFFRALKPKFCNGLFCVILLLLGSANLAKASHVAGADITYKCTATAGVFQVTLVVYRNCDVGVDLCSGTCGTACSQTISISGVDSSYAASNFGTSNLSLVSVRDININPDCPNSKNTCKNMNCVTPGTYTPGIERYEFVGYANIGPTSNIPSSCCNVRFSWTNCCRDAQIQTGSANQSFYIDAVVNRCLSVSPCNSSPELSNDPFVAVCSGQNYVFNNGAIDPDHDSLSFAFAPALQAYNTSVTYTAPWSAQQPMPWSGSNAAFPPAIYCDPFTGDISFTPSNATSSNFYGVMAIEVKQWKTVNGVPTIIGITRRDIEMVVLANCPPNNPPRLITNPLNTINPSTPKTSWEVCSGEQLCFKVTAKDTDFIPPTISDTTSLNWNKSLASLGATFLPTYNPANRHKAAPLGGPREDEYQFCWTPSDSVASSYPYYFTISAKDSRCPNPGKVTQAFSVKVLGRANITINNPPPQCGKVILSYTNNNPTRPPSNTLWQVSSVPGDYVMNSNSYTYVNRQTLPPLLFNTAGKYLVILKVNTPGPAGSGTFCSRIFYDTIYLDTIVKPFVHDTMLNCKGATVPITAVAKYGKAPYTYKWYNNFAQANNATLLPLNAPNYTTGTMLVVPTSTRYYTIKVTDSNGCFMFDSVKVGVKELPVSLLPDSSKVCYGDTFTLNPGNNMNNVKKYEWNTGDTVQVIRGTISGKYIVTLTDTFNCVQIDTVQVTVNPLPNVVATVFPSAAVCNGSTIVLTGTGASTYTWSDGVANGVGRIAHLNSYEVIGVDANGCSNKFSINLKYYPNPKAGFEIDKPLQCFQGNSFLFSDTSKIDSGTITPYWNFGDSTISTSISPNKSYTTRSPKIVKLMVVSNFGCKDSTSQTIYFPSINNNLQPICLVTVDSATTKNKIIWERVNKPAQKMYLIYKETNMSDVYAMVGMSSADSVGLFVDTLSNPNVKSDRYKLAAIDTCGNESAKSDAHKTMHLTVNSGLNNSWNLIWESYEGVTTNSINIYRGSSIGSMSLLTSVQGSINTYTDLTPPAGPLFYKIAVNFGVACDPSKLLKTSYAVTESNIVSTIQTGLMEPSWIQRVKIQPNPFNGLLYITTDTEKGFTLKLYDAIGRLVMSSELTPAVSVVDVSSLSEGMYMAEIINGNETSYRKLIKSR